MREAILDNSFKREGVKAAGTVSAIVVGGPIAATLAATLDVAVEALGLLGEKRTKELFDSEELTQKIIAKIKDSDDFASFVFDVWQKYNLESSQERRKWLKAFLENETDNDNNEFENFSKIEFIMQNANHRAIKLLSIVYSDVVQKRESVGEHDYLLNISRLVPLVQIVEKNMHEQDIERYINELAGYGLMSAMYGRMDGTLYNETKLGFIFIEYINSD